MFGQVLQRIFGRILYVRIWRNRLHVLDVKSGTAFDDEPWVAISGNPKKIVGIGKAARTTGDIVVNPFGHPRTLISDFTVAEQLLKHAVRAVSSGWWQPSPTIIVHPLEMLEGGLTQVEMRAFRELGIGAGAGTVYLCSLSRELTRDELRAGFGDSGARTGLVH